MLLKTGKQNQIGDYWALNNNNGAIGIYDTGLIIPKYSILDTIFLVLIEPFTNIFGISSISIGFKSLNLDPVFIDPTIIAAPANPIGIPTFEAFGFSGIPLFMNNYDAEIIFQVAVNPVDTGRVLIYTEYTQEDFN